MGRRIPVDLEEAVLHIVRGLDEESLRTVRQMNEATAMKLGKQGLGEWLRSSWGLSEKEGPLFEFFVEVHDLYEAKDISKVILHCIWADLSGNERDVDGVVREIHKAWEKKGQRPDGSRLFRGVLDLLDHAMKKDDPPA